MGGAAAAPPILLPHAASLLDWAGMRAEAAALYAHVLALWRNADPELEPRLRAMRSALERLTAEPATGT